MTKLYNLARQIEPILPRQRNQGGESLEPVNFLHLGATGTSLGQILTRCARLPNELQQEVLRQLGPHNLTLSLLVASCSASSFLGLIREGPDPSNELMLVPVELPDNDDTSWLCGKHDFDFWLYLFTRA